MMFEGWTGDTCEENVDECENSPCENGGMCMDMPGNFLCGCPMGRFPLIFESGIYFYPQCVLIKHVHQNYCNKMILIT